MTAMRVGLNATAPPTRATKCHAFDLDPDVGQRGHPPLAPDPLEADDREAHDAGPGPAVPIGSGNAGSDRSHGPAESLGHRPRARPGLDPRSPPLAPDTVARRGSEDPGGTGSPSAVALCCGPVSGATRGEVFAPPRLGSVRSSVLPPGIRWRPAGGASGRARASSPRIPTARAGLARRICLARKMAAMPSASCASHASRNSRSATAPGLRGRPRRVRRRIAVRGSPKQYVASMTSSSSAAGCGCRAAETRRPVFSRARAGASEGDSYVFTRAEDSKPGGNLDPPPPTLLGDRTTGCSRRVGGGAREVPGWNQLQPPGQRQPRPVRVAWRRCFGSPGGSHARHAEAGDRRAGS